MRFKRQCKRCGKWFRPVGKDVKYCEECKKTLNKLRIINQRETWKKKKKINKS